MLMRLFGSCRKRQASRDIFFVPRLEPLEDRLTPSSIPPLNPAIINQLTTSMSLVAQQQSNQPPSNQPLLTAFQFSYAQASQQNAGNPGALNGLVVSEVVLTLDQIYTLLGVNNPTLSANLANAQNAIAANPASNTTFGAMTGQLAQAVILSAFLGGDMSDMSSSTSAAPT